MQVDGVLEGLVEWTLFGADFNLDLDVDGGDFLVWQQGFGLMGTADRMDGDANANGNVDAADLADWEEHVGEPARETVLTIVPEPATWILLAWLALTLPTQLQKHR